MYWFAQFFVKSLLKSRGSANLHFCPQLWTNVFALKYETLELTRSNSLWIPISHSSTVAAVEGASRKLVKRLPIKISVWKESTILYKALKSVQKASYFLKCIFKCALIHSPFKKCNRLMPGSFRFQCRWRLPPQSIFYFYLRVIFMCTLSTSKMK